MIELFLVRHGQTKWNVEKRLQGTLDSDLTDEGVIQAIKLGEKLESMEFSKVFASPSGRTLRTAELVKPKNSISILEDTRLKEMGFGDIEGYEMENLEDNLKNQIRLMHERPDIYNPSAYNGETYESLLGRTSSFLDEIIKKEDGKILIVAHGMSLMAMIANINKIEVQDFWKRGLKPNVSLSIYDYYNGLFDEKLFYDTSHYE